MKALIAISIILFSFGIAQAETKRATAGWTFPTELNGTIDGFRIYDQDNKVVRQVSNPAARATSFDVVTAAGECASYYMTAYKGEEVYPISNIAMLCAAREALQAVGTFTIEIK